MNSEPALRGLILSSGSPYRKLLLQRLGIPFTCQSPHIDERATGNEAPQHLVVRLAKLKARVVAAKNPQAIVIGSDQVAVIDGRIIGKPGNHQAAARQLASCSGKTIKFLTAISIQSLATGFTQQHTDCTQVHFRSLEPEEIERYLQQEKPYDCVGAFKAESLGVVLFERIISEDPTAIIGLPLIRTAAMLRDAGLKLP